MRVSSRVWRVALLLWASLLVPAQVVEFESGGLRYQTLTRDGVTIMFAHLPTQIRNYGIIQVAVTNGSTAPYTVRPEDFHFESASGVDVHAVPATEVISELVRGASGSDVVKLVTTYEAGLYGIQRIHSTNGYEQRRQAALAVGGAKGVRAAGAASAIAMVETTLRPGASTDGAIFYPIMRSAGEAVLKVSAGDREFEFKPSLPAGAGR